VKRDRGAATPLVVGLVASSVLLASILLGLGAALADATRLAHTADSAALGAADTLLGWNTGEPCAVAEALARAHQARLTSCSVGETHVTVTVLRSILSIPVTRSARAGAADGR
jgi:secretion/DNA translocation related TadE-like protein